jgi:hypothetical protein
VLVEDLLAVRAQDLVARRALQEQVLHELDRSVHVAPRTEQR